MSAYIQGGVIEVQAETGLRSAVTRSSSIQSSSTMARKSVRARKRVSSRKIAKSRKVSAKATYTVLAESPTKVRILFDRPMALRLSNPRNYQFFPSLAVLGVAVNFDRQEVLLTTSEQEPVNYTIRIRTKEKLGKPNKRGQYRLGAAALTAPISNFKGFVPVEIPTQTPTSTPTPSPTATSTPTPLPPADTSLPFVVGAISGGNTKVVVGFSEAMGDSAANAASYSIVQENVNAEVGTIKVLSAKFSNDNRLAVELTTSSQNEVTYRVTAVNVYDLAGNPLQGKQIVANLILDRSSATFAGTPPSGVELTDSDGDFVSDSEELRGWIVTVLLANGQGVTREVTSDPGNADTDGDGLADGVEKALTTDPRDADTDDDQLTDYQEFNEIFSDPTRQDTDADSLFDGLEWDFFKTSPLFKDTDGDQLSDDLEVVTANRNARNADIPLPQIEVGEVSLSLDVRFTATSSTGSRTLDTKSVESSLQQSETKSFSKSDSTMNEFTAKVGVEQGWKVGAGFAGSEGKVSVEAGYTGQWTSQFTQESSEETQKTVANTFSTEKEATQEETVTRSIEGASMKVAVSIRSIGNLAFNLSNLQITAFLQDPRRPGRLLPIATLKPESSVPNTFAMGPLVPVRGPFVFENDQLFPALVQNLMLDPRGLIFKVANYDIADELGRNFAFTSQEINDRTAPLIIDFGGADTDGDGEGDNSERYRVATSAGRVIDTDGDGDIDENDRRVTFDPSGKQLGITLQEALENIVGLTYYKEETTPTTSLSKLDQENSFSTRVVNGTERVWRIRQVSKELTNPLKEWVILTPGGIIAPATPFETLILSPERGITLAFVQDLDNDGITAAWEYIYNCSDTRIDTDRDNLTDFQEVYGGWPVQVVGKGAYTGYSSCARSDSDLDGLSDEFEATRVTDVDTDGDGTPDLFDVPAGLDAKNPDTDMDGANDFEEINGYTIELRFPVDTNGDGTPDLFNVTVTTDPLNPDTDGDTVKDGDERTLGIDPTVDDGDKVFDDDGDGLRNFEETLVRTVSFFRVSSTKNVQGQQVTCNAADSQACNDLVPISLVNNTDSDGDGLTDRQERDIGTHPRLVDTDGDGLTDFQEVEITFPGGVETITEVTDPLDADTDNDLRSDGAEVNTPWIVRVNKVGEAPYEIFSNPLVADADLDGLVDGEELALGTNPTAPDGFDTDEDGFGDGAEVAPGRGTNPLTPDQKVTFTYTNIKVVGDCDSGTDGSDQWVGQLRLRLSPTESTDTVVRDLFTSGIIDNVSEGDDVSISDGRTLVLSEGRSVVASSATLCEQDGANDGACSRDGDPDEFLDNFSETFSYPVSSQTKVYMQKEGGTDDDCRLDITLTINPVL